MDPTTQRMMMGSSGGQAGSLWVDKSLFLPDGSGGFVSQLNDTQEGNGVFLAVGTQATILRSTDGATWTRISPPSGTLSSEIFYSIIYSSSLGRFIITGSDRLIYSDDDGLTWTTSVSGVGAFHAIAFGNSQFLAVGGTGSASLLYKSSDGISWTSMSAPSGVTETLTSVAYGTPSGATNGRFVVIGNGAGGARLIYANGSLIIWVNLGLTATDTWEHVCWAGGSINLYVVSGYVTSTNAPFIKTSASGAAAFTTSYTNTAQIGTKPSYTISYIGSTIVLGGAENQIVTSTTGTSWTVTQSAQNLDSTIYGLCYSNSLTRYVFVGYAPNSYVNNASLWYSSSLSRSTSTIVYDGPKLLSAVYAQALNLYFVAGSAGKVFTSSDLDTWTGKYLSNSFEVYVLLYDGTRVIASGGTASTGPSYVYSTTDGATWSLNYTSASSLHRIRTGIYGGYSASSVQYLLAGETASGAATILYSTNGTTWTTNTSVASTSYKSSFRVNDPTNIGIPFTVLGSVGNGSTGSDTGSTFDPANTVVGFEVIPNANTGGSNTGASVDGLVFMQEPSLANSRFVYAVNRSSACYLITATYPTAVFTNRSVGDARTLNSLAIEPPSGVIIAVGAEDTGGGGGTGYIPYIQTSTDSATWTQRSTPTYKGELFCVTYATTHFIAVGNGGIVLVSEL